MSVAGGPGAIVPRPCRSCRELVYDLRYPKTGRIAPIEVRTSNNGNIVVDLEARTYSILFGEALGRTRAFTGPDVVLHVNHFAACPQAPRWRPRPVTKKARA